MTVTITIDTIGPQIVGQPFSVTGTYNNSVTTWSDTLNFRDDGGSVEGTIPISMNVAASTAFAYVHPGFSAAGSHVVHVKDAASGAIGTSNSFTVSAAKSITPTVPTGTVTGVGFNFTGTLTGYGSAPSLTYSIDGGTPAAVTGVTTTGWSMTLVGPAAGSHTIVVTDGSITGQASFTTAAPAKIIKPTAPSGVVAGTAFSFTGSLSNYTSPPALTYSLDGGLPKTVTGVSSTAWSMQLTIATAGTHTIVVTDGTVQGTTGPFTVAAAPVIIAPNAPSGTVAGVAFTFTGSLSGYTSIPALTYTIDAGSPVAMTGITLTGWSMQITAPPAGSHTISVSDGTNVGGPVSFTTAAQPNKIITPIVPNNTVAGVAFTFTGTLTNYVSAPSLTYSIDGATPVAITGVTSTGWSMSVTAPAAGNHAMVVTDGTTTGSTNFTTAAVTKTIHPNAPTSPVAGSPFTFTGTLSGYTTAPSLTYSVDSGTPTALGGVTTSGWSTNITIATAGSHTVVVSDGAGNNGSVTFTVAAAARTITPNNPGTVVANSSFTFTGTLTGYSAATAIVTASSGGSFTDNNGGVWTINAGVVQLNGTNAGFSQAVVEIALVGTGSAQTVWQENQPGNWFFWTATGSTWTAGANPLANDVVPSLTYSLDGGAAVQMTGETSTGWSMTISSPAAGTHTLSVSDGTITGGPVTFSSIVSTGIPLLDARIQNPPQTFTDNSGNLYYITLAAQVALNHVADTTTGQVAYMANIGGVVWHANYAGNWFSKASSTSPWVAGSNPLPSAQWAVSQGVATGAMARRAYDLLGVFGYNAHIDQGGMSNPSILITAYTYLNARICRQQASPFSSGNLQSFASGMPGLKFEGMPMLAYSHDFNGSGSGGAANNVVTNMTTFLSDVGGATRLFGFEGQNECNLFDSGSGVAAWQAGNIGYANACRSITALANVPMLNLTIGNPNEAQAEQIAAQMGNQTGYGINWQNGHNYPNDGQGGGINLNGTAGIGEMFTDQAVSAPGRPMNWTEWGYALSGGNGAHVTNNAGAKMIVNGFILCYEGYLAGSFEFEPFDDTGEGYSLFNSSGTPNGMATGIHNFTTIMLDTGATASTFIPGSLAFSVAFSGSGTAPTIRLYQKADGSYWITAYNCDAVQTTGANPTDITPAAGIATITLSAARAVTTFDYMAGTSGTSLGSVTTFALSVQGYCKIAKIV